jgi:hypothetical protein
MPDRKNLPTLDDCPQSQTAHDGRDLPDGTEG